MATNSGAWADIVMPERRLKPRLKVPYAARVWGLDAEGGAVKEDGLIENLSSSGLYLRLPRSIPDGTHVSVVARLSMSGVESRDALRLVAGGIVVRAEALPHGDCGVAVKFTRRRVL